MPPVILLRNVSQPGNLLTQKQKEQDGMAAKNLDQLVRKIVWVIQEDGFPVRDEVYLRFQRQNLSFVSYKSDVRNCQTIQEVHENHYNEEDECNKKDGADGVG